MPWNMNPPPLLQEGLAVWLEKVEGDEGDAVGDQSVVHDSCGDPLPLLDPRRFFSPDQVHRSYGHAGVFTGYLIRRFGWDSIRGFYRKAERLRFRAVFWKHFGISFEDAWVCVTTTLWRWQVSTRGASRMGFSTSCHDAAKRKGSSVACQAAGALRYALSRFAFLEHTCVFADIGKERLRRRNSGLPRVYNGMVFKELNLCSEVS